MYQYEIKNMVLNPNVEKSLIIDGMAVRIPLLQERLLEYMIRHAGQTIPINTILDDVWGTGEHTQNAFSVALAELHKVLPEHIRIVNVRSKGYVFDHKVVVKKWRYNNIEEKIVNSTHLNTYVWLGFIAVCVICGVIWRISERYFDQQSKQVNYHIANIDDLYTWDVLAGTPRFAPDGKFLAYRLSRSPRKADFLGLYNLTIGDTNALVPMGFNDGFAWDLTGNRIVYQHRANGNCEIRLLTFSQDRQSFNTKRLTPCAKRSGMLSFKWFSDNAFYVNLTETDEITSANGLPLHHIYSFNIISGERNRVVMADYQGGVGFFSLEYDASSQCLYFLQSYHFQTTDVYRYCNNSIDKLHTLDYELTDFTVDNDKLVYKNNHQQFMINSPAADFTNPQILLRPQNLPIYEPQLYGEKFAYVAGNKFGFSLHKLRLDKLTANGLTAAKPAKVAMPNLRADELANYNGHLVFSSRQTGVNQLYIRLASGNIVKLSQMSKDEHITHVDIANNMVAISYFERVDIYRLEGQVLHLVHTFKGAKHGIIHASGDKLLLQTENSQGEGVIVEKQLNSLAATGLVIKEAKWAIYHNQRVVYLRADNVLIAIENGVHQPIASGLDVRSIVHIAIDNNSLYYITIDGANSSVTELNLLTGVKTLLPMAGLHPTRIEKIGDSLYIRSRDTLKPSLMIGDLITTQ